MADFRPRLYGPGPGLIAHSTGRVDLPLRLRPARRAAVRGCAASAVFSFGENGQKVYFWAALKIYP